MRVRSSVLIPLLAVILSSVACGEASAVGRYLLAWWREAGVYESGSIIRVYVFDENGDPLGGRRIYTSWGVHQSTTSTALNHLGWCNDIVLDPSADRDVLVEDAAISDVSPLFSTAQRPREGHYLYEVGFMYKADEAGPGTFDISTNCTFNPRGSTETDAPYTKSLIYNSIDCAIDTSDYFSLGTWSDEFNQTFTVPAGVNRIVGVNTSGGIGDNYWLTITVKIKQGGPTGPVIYSRSSADVYGGDIPPFRDAQWIPFGANACPVTPGATYCLTLTRVGGLNAYHVANVYGGGQYYEGTTPFADRELVGFVVGMSYAQAAVGAIAGAITDGDGDPIADATVTADPGGYSATTGAGGAYAIANVPPGTYTVEAWKQGFTRETQAGVIVVADQTTTVDLTLQPSLLTNPGFETGDLTGWTPFGVGMLAFPDGEWAISSHSGDYYAGAVAMYDTKNGGLYQRVVGVQPEQAHTLSGWFYTDSWANGRQDEYPSNCQARIGLSVSGSTDPASTDIVWSDWAYNQNQWDSLQVAATPTSTAATVFLQYSQQSAYEWQKNAFDDIWLAPAATVTVTSPLLGVGWQQISLPVDPSDPSPTAVFGAIPISGALYRWNAATQAYVAYQTGDPNGFGDCHTGEGYWLHLTSPATISYQGIPTAGTQQIALPTGGWRMIGQPHGSSTPLANCTVSDLGGGGGTNPYYEAATMGWVSSRLYSYNPATDSYALVGPDPWNASSALAPWCGYWLRGGDLDLGLNIP